MNPNPQSFTELKQSFGNSMSLSFESEGFSPLVGRIFALLLFSSEPLSLQDMADQLGVTKAAVSVQVRALEKYCMCQKIPTGSDRRDYYHIAEDFSVISLRNTMQKIQRVQDQCQLLLDALEHISEIRQEELPAREVVSRRFQEAVALQRLFLSRFEGFEEEWRRVRQELFPEE